MEITEVRVALHEPATRPGPVQSQSRAYRSPTMEGQGAVSGVEEGRRTGEQRLRAYATLTFDQCFVVRNVKIIDGKNGLFVAMPAHKPKVACLKCQFKNEAGGRFCTQCGNSMPRSWGPGTDRAGWGMAPEGPSHRDIAHPITVEFRNYLQRTVLAAYEAERAKAQRQTPGAAVSA